MVSSKDKIYKKLNTLIDYTSMKSTPIQSQFKPYEREIQYIYILDKEMQRVIICLMSSYIEGS